MTAALGEQVNRIVEEFNKSQDTIEVQAVFKGGYADTMNAAFRAGQPPHLVQDVTKAAEAIKAKDAAEIPMTSSWVS